MRALGCCAYLYIFIPVLVILVSVSFGSSAWAPGTETPYTGLNHARGKRSPFILAIQVTRPPGMFQMSLRRPYIFNMMGNLTSLIMSSNMTNFLRRGFVGTQILQPQVAAAVAPTPNNMARAAEAESRQEDLEIELLD